MSIMEPIWRNKLRISGALTAATIVACPILYEFHRHERIISQSCGVLMPAESELLYSQELSTWHDAEHEFAYLMPEPDARALISRCEADGYRLAAFDKYKVSPAILKAVGSELTDSEEGSLQACYARGYTPENDAWSYIVVGRYFIFRFYTQ